jgi:hypothetical protein
MPQPYNYLKPQNPSGGFAQSLLRGYGLGQQIKQRNQQSALLEQKQDAMELKQTQDKIAHERKVLGQIKLKELVASNNANPTAWAEYYGEFPEAQEIASKVAAVLKLGKDDNTKNLLLRAKSAIMRKSPETAAKLFREYGKLYEKTSPDTQEMYEDMANNILFDQSKAKGYIDMVGFSIFGEKYATQEQTEAKYKKDLATAKLTDEQTKIVGQDADTRAVAAGNVSKKIIADAKALKAKNDGFLTPAEKVDFQLKLQKAYAVDGGEDFRKIDLAYENIKGISKESGVGALTTILNYYKMIDPSSTVTANETANASNAPGWSSASKALYNKIFKDGDIDPVAYKQFLHEASQIRNNAKKASDRTRAKITSQAKSLNLDLKGIFNPETDAKTADNSPSIDKDSKGRPSWHKDYGKN